jgi:hypothetical protein
MTSTKFEFTTSDENKQKYADYIHDKIKKGEIKLSDSNHKLPFDTRDKDALAEMMNIFERIKQNYAQNKTDGNQNTVFKQYLCEVIKGKHKYNIFNTYYHIPSPFWGIPEGFIPFFVLLTFRFKGTGGSDLNSKYFNETPPNPKVETFQDHFNEIIDLFKEIFENPDTEISEGCKYQDIVDFILKKDLIHIDSLTQENPPKYDPTFAPFPWAVYNKNQKFIDMFKIIVERGESDTESNTDTESVSETESNTDTETTTKSIDTIRGEASYLPTKPSALRPSYNLNTTARPGRSGLGSRRRSGPRSPRRGGKSTRKAKHANARKTRRQPKQNRKTKRQRK